MDNQRTFSKEEISRILAKASRIQTQKDLYGDEQGLTEEELIHIAEEVGIDKDSLYEAIHNPHLNELDSRFRWFRSSSNLQEIRTVSGEINEEIWEHAVQEIRRVSGGIGNVSKVGKTFEWKQKIKELGYKYLSFTPQNGTTQIHFISKWSGLELILTILPLIMGAGLTGIILDGTSLPNIAYFLIPLLGGLTAVSAGRIFLKNYFEKQKSVFREIVRSVSKKLNSLHSQDITLDEHETYREEPIPGTNTPRRERS